MARQDISRPWNAKEIHQSSNQPHRNTEAEPHDFDSLGAPTKRRLAYLVRCLQQVNEASALEMKWQCPSDDDRDENMRAFLTKTAATKDIPPHAILPFLADTSCLHAWREVVARCSSYMHRVNVPGTNTWLDMRTRAMIFVHLRREIATNFEEVKQRVERFEDVYSGIQLKLVTLEAYVFMSQQKDKQDEEIAIQRFKAGLPLELCELGSGDTAAPAALGLKKVR